MALETIKSYGNYRALGLDQNSSMVVINFFSIKEPNIPRGARPAEEKSAVEQAETLEQTQDSLWNEL